MFRITVLALRLLRRLVDSWLICGAHGNGMSTANNTTAGKDEKCVKMLRREQAEDRQLSVKEDYIETGRK